MTKKKPTYEELERKIGELEEEVRKGKQSEETLRAARDYAQSIIESSLDMIVAVGKDRRIIEFNPAAQKTFGYKREEVLGKHVDILYQNKEEGKRISEQVLKGGRFVGEITNVRKNGETFTSLLSVAVMRDQHGKVVGVVGSSRDITERKRMEEKLRESEETARALLNAPTEPLVLLDIRGTIIDLNETAAKAFGKSADKYIGRCIYDLFQAEAAEKLKAYNEKVIDSGLPVRYEGEREVRLLDTAILEVFFDNTIYPVFDETGKVERLAFFSRDISDRKKLEKKLQESEQQQNIIFDNIPAPVLIHDEEGAILYINATGAKLLEWHVSDLIGKHLSNILLIKDDASQILDRESRTFEYGVNKYNTTYVSRTGRQFIVEVYESEISYYGRHAFLSLVCNIT